MKTYEDSQFGNAFYALWIGVLTAAVLGGCTSNTLHVVRGDAREELLTNCTKISRKELLQPRASVQRNVCFDGELYVGSEYTMLIIAGDMDVAVYLSVGDSTRSDLQPHSGTQVSIVGDIQYEKLCWGLGKLTATEQAICAPVSRPIDLIKGSLILQ